MVGGWAWAGHCTVWNDATAVKCNDKGKGGGSSTRIGIESDINARTVLAPVDRRRTLADEIRESVRQRGSANGRQYNGTGTIIMGIQLAVYEMMLSYTENPGTVVSSDQYELFFSFRFQVHRGF